MPTTAGGMTFYEEQFETGVWLGLTQFIDAFNAASNNCLILEPGARKGRKPVETQMADIASLIQRRNPSGTGNLTPGKHANYEHASIKCFRAAPISLTRQEWVDLGLDTAEGTRIYGEQFGVMQAQDYLNTVLAALVGSINSIGDPDAVLDITAETPDTLHFAAINRFASLMGDRRQALSCLAMHSVPLRDLIGDALANLAIAFQVGQLTVYNGGVPSMGLQQLVTDSPALVNEGGSGSADDTYNVLGLVQGAARVKTGPQSQVFAPITGSASSTPENQQNLLSVEWEFELQVRGVSYVGTGGAATNPTAAQLADPSNWDLVASSHKLGPGVLLITD